MKKIYMCLMDDIFSVSLEFFMFFAYLKQLIH